MTTVRKHPSHGKRPGRGATAAFALATAIVLILAVPAVARADGDPASDYLYTQWAFLPAGASASQQAQLRAVTQTARAQGEPIKIAVIASPYDLGSVTPLWRRPQTYAQFLGIELSYVYHGTLLIVMPNGFGVYDDKRPVAADRRALAHLTIRPGLAGLVATAETAARQLAAASGHPLPTATPKPRRSTGSGAQLQPGPAGLAVLGIGGMMIAAAWAASLRMRPPRRRRRGRWPAQATRRWPRIPSGNLPSVPRMLLLLVPVAVGVRALAAIVVPLHARGAASPLPSHVTDRGFTWPARARPAPAFALRDQNGIPVSLRSVHGRVAILAFLDPVCRKLCPLEASILGKVDRRFSPRTRPPIVAVSVDPWGDARHNLLQDIRKWNVGSSWRWAVGSRTALSRTWRAYGIGVQDRKITIHGLTVHEIAHIELIYLIDQHGDERRLYPYPFTVEDVVRGVKQLEAGGT